MTILKAHFANGGAFLDHYLPESVQGGIFFPTRKPLAIGEAVVVSVRHPTVTESSVFPAGTVNQSAYRSNDVPRANVSE